MKTAILIGIAALFCVFGCASRKVTPTGAPSHLPDYGNDAVALNEVINSDASEPNNNQTEATSIFTTGVAQYFTLTENDVDWFYFIADSLKKYQVVTHPGNGEANLNVHVFEQNGGSQILSQGNDTLSLFSPLHSDTCYLRVSGNGATYYLISVTAITP